MLIKYLKKGSQNIRWFECLQSQSCLEHGDQNTLREKAGQESHEAGTAVWKQKLCWERYSRKELDSSKRS